MSLMQPYVAYWLRRLGWPALVGAALFLGAIAFYIVRGSSVDHRLHYLETHISQMRNAVVMRQQSWMHEAPDAAVYTFYQFLPAEKSVPDQLEKVFDAAYENNLQVLQGTFTLTRDPHAAMSRYQVTLPITGSYSSIRIFINRVLKEIPSATLDNIAFRREGVKVMNVDAEVKFTLYLGKDK